MISYKNKVPKKYVLQDVPFFHLFLHKVYIFSLYLIFISIPFRGRNTMGISISTKLSCSSFLHFDLKQEEIHVLNQHFNIEKLYTDKLTLFSIKQATVSQNLYNLFFLINQQSFEAILFPLSNLQQCAVMQKEHLHQIKFSQSFGNKSVHCFSQKVKQRILQFLGDKINYSQDKKTRY